MRTPKIHALNSLIDYLNNKGYSINKYPLDTSPINSNAWLSGFIEADGHFSVRVSIDNNDKLKRIACSLELVQKEQDLLGIKSSNVLSRIGDEILLCQVKDFNKNLAKYPHYRIRTTSLKGNLNLKQYLCEYPLFSTKYLDYLDWLKVLDYIARKEHRIYFKEIAKIKQSMNNNRTYFSWDHLQNFYKLHD